MSPEAKNEKSTDPVTPELGVTQPEVVTPKVAPEVVTPAPEPEPMFPVHEPVMDPPAPEVVAAYDSLAEYPNGVIVDSTLAETEEEEPHLAFEDYLLLSNISAFDAGVIGRTAGKYARPFSAWHAARVAVLGG